MYLKMDQSLVGYSHNFCATFTSAHHAGRTKCRLKVLQLSYVIFFIGFFNYIFLSILRSSLQIIFMYFNLQMTVFKLLTLQRIEHQSNSSHFYSFKYLHYYLILFLDTINSSLFCKQYCTFKKKKTNKIVTCPSSSQFGALHGCF